MFCNGNIFFVPSQHYLCVDPFNQINVPHFSKKATRIYQQALLCAVYGSTWRSSVGGNISEHLEISWWTKPWNHTGFPLRCTPLQDQVLPPHMVSRRPENRETPEICRPPESWKKKTPHLSFPNTPRHLDFPVVTDLMVSTGVNGSLGIHGSHRIASHLPPIGSVVDIAAAWAGQGLCNLGPWQLHGRKFRDPMERMGICGEKLLQFVNSDVNRLSHLRIYQKFSINSPMSYDSAYATLTPLQFLLPRGTCWFPLRNCLTQAYATQGFCLRKPLMTQLLQLTAQVSTWVANIMLNLGSQAQISRAKRCGVIGKSIHESCEKLWFYWRNSRFGPHCKIF